MTNEHHPVLTEPSPLAASTDYLLIIGGTVTAAGSLLPWTHATIFFTTLNRNGMQLGVNRSFSVNGLITLIFGILGVIVAVIHMKRDVQPIAYAFVAAVGGIVSLGIGLNGIREAMNYTVAVKSGLLFVSAGIGSGLWMVILGSVGITVGSCMSLATRRNHEPNGRSITTRR